MDVRDIKKVDILKLKLDVNNPRFAELYNGSDNQDELTEYLLNSESATEIVKEIDESKEFYIDRPLWVLENKSGEYIVKDGNRRLAALLALRAPSSFGLSQRRQIINEIPAIIYKTEEEVNKRIRLEHTHSSFKEWDRIAKALEVYKMRLGGTSIDSQSIKELDSAPDQLVKLASFYFAAVKVSGDDLKKLLRRGRGNRGGKTTVFERLFRYRTLCGYDFEGKPSYEINIVDQKLFESYVVAMVSCLKDDTTITHITVDKEKEAFLNRLAKYGFKPGKKPPTRKGSKTVTATPPTALVPPATPSKESRKSIKKSPKYTRKATPMAIDKLIRECYDLDHLYFTNAKTAMTRVTFECVMKYVIENTEYKKGNTLAKSNYFLNAYMRGGRPLPMTDFTKMKELFSQLISNKGTRKAFIDFDLNNPHQIIHNYRVTAVPANAITLCENLIPLIEFMLQDEKDLIADLDLTKL